jgi:hypothetical protein
MTCRKKGFCSSNKLLCFKDRMDDNPTEFTFNESYEKFKELGRYTSESKRHIAIFGEKSNDTFTYVIYSWDLSEYDYIGEGYWCCSRGGGIYSDLITVKSEAERELKACR